MIDQLRMILKTTRDMARAGYQPGSDPGWWRVWHDRPYLDERRITVPMGRPEQQLILEAGARSGRPIAVPGTALAGNEISAAVRLRGIRIVTEQPETRTNADPQSLSAILRAGAGQLRR